jgi:SOS-response transcriptional repressor LexA
MEEAHSAYETSRDHLERLRREALAVGKESQAGEYGTLVRQIGERIQEIAQTIAEQYLARVRPRTSTASPHVDSPADRVTQQSLHFLPVIGPIPAGQTRISHDDIQNVVTAVNEATIDGIRYCFRRLRGEGDLIRLDQQEYNYYLSQVIGDSMNLADLNEGDYVILRQPRSLPLSPQSSDIVAASITDMDREVTLKRYLREGKAIVLKPESSNPEHKSYEFSEDDPSVDIVGVAVAVLKPIE